MRMRVVFLHWIFSNGIREHYLLGLEIFQRRADTREDSAGTQSWCHFCGHCTLWENLCLLIPRLQHQHMGSRDLRATQENWVGSTRVLDSTIHPWLPTHSHGKCWREGGDVQCWDGEEGKVTRNQTKNVPEHCHESRWEVWTICHFKLFMNSFF